MSSETDDEREKEKGRIAVWLSPSQIEFLANEWRKIPENESEFVLKNWSEISFRLITALHKAGIIYEAKFPSDSESYQLGKSNS